MNRISYEALGKAPNMLYHAVMEYMKTLVEYNQQRETATPEQLKKAIEREIALVIDQAPDLRKQLSVSTPKPHPTTPERQYVNLIWTTQEKVVLLAQITCVLEEGGENEI